MDDAETGLQGQSNPIVFFDIALGGEFYFILLTLTPR